MNYLIYEDAAVQIWYCSFDGEIHLTHKDTNKTEQLTFMEFVRAIDTIPDRSPEWKKEIITTWAANCRIIQEIA